MQISGLENTFMVSCCPLWATDMPLLLIFTEFVAYFVTSTTVTVVPVIVTTGMKGDYYNMHQ